MPLVDLEVSLTEEERRIRGTANRFAAEAALDTRTQRSVWGEAPPQRSVAGARS